MKALALLLLVTLLMPGAAPQRRSRAGAARTTVGARRWMKSLTLREQAAQLIFIPFHGSTPNSRSREYRQFVHLVRDVGVGGLILVNWNQGHVIQKAEPHALAAFINRMQRLAKVPLMVGGDFERGASMRVDGTTLFPHAMAFGATFDPAFTRYEGEVTAREARALGVQWVYYPVADVNNNPDNPIINIRSFGENPEEVAAHVRAFIEGAHSDRKHYVLTTAKHFPGHGDTAVDTHLNLATITADRERLNRVELVPFRAAIDAGVDSIMTAHIAVPALAPPEIPATLSPAILTGLLRDQLHFRGLVVTDALEMGGIVKSFGTGEAAVRALEAGADALLMPPDPEAALKAVMAAIQSGRLTRKRIEDSLERLLEAKEKVGLARQRFVDVEAISDVINSPEANQKAQEIADRAVTLVKNEAGVVPLRDPAANCFVVMAESRYATGGQAFTQEVRRRARNSSILQLDPTITGMALDDTLRNTASCPSFAVAAFSSVSAFRGSVGLGGELPRALQAIIDTGKPVTLIALGNPYLVRSFPKVSAYITTFSTVPPSEIAAVKALWGEIPIRGRLPVTIPEVAGYGEGIQLPARVQSATTSQ